MKYFVNTPWLFKKIWSSYIWNMDTNGECIYLTFDDGPHPVATPFVLDQLKKYNAKATFFCIGKNVMAHQDIYKRIREEGHAVGNHTQHHLDGWKTDNKNYLKDIRHAEKYIDSNLFRPPYGRIKSSQAKKIRSKYKIIMWSVLSGDFDQTITRERCLKNVIDRAGPGSIVVFHDSEKAFPLLQYTLPGVLEFFSGNGYRMEGL